MPSFFFYAKELADNSSVSGSNKCTFITFSFYFNELLEVICNTVQSQNIWMRASLIYAHSCQQHKLKA